jgi:MoaA/NifB/PqqE/SkfB family radical SAM enzyme
VEISLDAANPALNNRIRLSRKSTGDAFRESISAIEACLAANIKVRVITTLNTWNQQQLPDLADLLDRIGVRDWALSWTIPAGRAARIYDQLRPDENVIQEELTRVRERHPAMRLRYSNRCPNLFNRFYFLVLPDGQIATEDMNAGKKRTFGSALEIPLPSVWTRNNFDLEAHFSKWVGNRLRPVT